MHPRRPKRLRAALDTVVPLDGGADEAGVGEGEAGCEKVGHCGRTKHGEGQGATTETERRAVSVVVASVAFEGLLFGIFWRSLFKG